MTDPAMLGHLNWLHKITQGDPPVCPDLWWGPASHLWFCELSGANPDESLRLIRAEGETPELAIARARVKWEEPRADATGPG